MSPNAQDMNKDDIDTNTGTQQQWRSLSGISNPVGMQRTLPSCYSDVDGPPLTLGSQASIPDRMKYLSSIIDDVLRELDDDEPFDSDMSDVAGTPQ